MLPDSVLFRRFTQQGNFKWIITSPPYYGLKAYIPDQWLRYWFLGGSSQVEYSSLGQLLHSSPMVFASELRRVWQNVAAISASNARLAIRFGAINDRKLDPPELIRTSLLNSGWEMTKVLPAGTAKEGKRQAEHFVRSKAHPIEELDVFAALA
jgi:hypothetical protein